ncbi:MAG: gamma-glutamylcyclotransferase family protein [Alphaproteobacteria bacterium]
MEDRLLYFAYGRNMHPEIMGERCPDAAFAGLAVLNTHRIMINGRGVSTVIADPGHSVHGVLWHLTQRCESTLDMIEGVAKGHYAREKAHPIPEAGSASPALIYLAHDTTPGSPRPGYLESLEEAAYTHRFPVHYRRHLASLRQAAG